MLVSAGILRVGVRSPGAGISGSCEPPGLGAGKSCTSSLPLSLPTSQLPHFLFTSVNPKDVRRKTTDPTHQGQIN